MSAARARARGAVLSLGLGWVWSSPLALGAIIAGCLAALVLERALGALADTAEVRGDIHALAARVAAESAASDYVSSGGVDVARAIDTGNGLIVETTIAPLADGSQLRLSAQVAEQRFDFLFQQIAGGTPPAFGRSLTVAPEAVVPSEWLTTNTMVREDLPRFSAAPSPVLLGAVAAIAVVDAGLALLRLPAGTDRCDYVLGGGRDQRAPRIPEGGVVQVIGNLWVDCSGAPLELTLPGDLTIVVHGNVYLGRSVRVLGPGKLTIATCADGGTSFIDRDGNGRWSQGEDLLAAVAFAGPVEGAGNVYVGMPREAATSIDLQLGLFVAGALHVGAEEARLHGPVVLAAAGVRIGKGAGQLLCAGTRLPSLWRATLPGFVAVGGPRPGPLTPLHQEPLYPAAPAR